MIRLRDIPKDDDLRSSSSGDPSPASGRPARKPRGVPAPPPPSTAELTIFNPAQLAAMWGVAHDKVLEFIKTGELEAFNVASKQSRRPQFKVTLAAVKAFQERRSGHDPARSAPPVTPRRTSSKKSKSLSREYF
jgi:hypothetical protein